MRYGRKSTVLIVRKTKEVHLEATAAVKMWGRSKDHSMLYTSFVSDGYSSAFLSTKN